jgi:hypothetical protein
MFAQSMWRYTRLDDYSSNASSLSMAAAAAAAAAAGNGKSGGSNGGGSGGEVLVSGLPAGLRDYL